MFESNCKILVVDDFETMRNITKHILKSLGYTNIDQADNGRSALKMLQHGGYDLIISDWNMPDVDGLRMLKAIRSNNFFRDIPVLMITAEMKREQVISAAQAGVDGYIGKPFSPQDLKEKLQLVYDKRVKSQTLA